MSSHIKDPHTVPYDDDGERHLPDDDSPSHGGEEDGIFPIDLVTNGDHLGSDMKPKVRQSWRQDSSDEAGSIIASVADQTEGHTGRHIKADNSNNGASEHEDDAMEQTENESIEQTDAETIEETGDQDNDDTEYQDDDHTETQDDDGSEEQDDEDTEEQDDEDTEEQSNEDIDEDVEMIDTEDEYNQEELDVDTSVCTACATMYSVYPTLSCTRPHTDAESPCLMCMVNKDQVRHFCAKVKPKYYRELARVQNAAAAFNAEPNAQTHGKLEEAQKIFNGLECGFDRTLPYDQQPAAIHVPIDDDALSQLYTYMVFEQTVRVSQMLRTIRMSPQVREFRIDSVYDWHYILGLNAFKEHKTLESLAAQLTGNEQQDPCDSCAAGLGMFKTCVRPRLPPGGLPPDALPNRMKGVIGNRCANCNIRQKKCSLDKDPL